MYAHMSCEMLPLYFYIAGSSQESADFRFCILPLGTNGGKYQIHTAVGHQLARSNERKRANGW